MSGVCRYYGGCTTRRRSEGIGDAMGKESGDQVGGDRRSTRQGVSTRYTCDQTSTRARDDVRALHLSRARGMWTEVRGKGTRGGPEVHGGRGRTHESAGQGKGPRPGTEVGDGDGPGPPIDDEDGKGIESRIEQSCGDLVGKLSRGGT